MDWRERIEQAWAIYSGLERERLVLITELIESVPLDQSIDDITLGYISGICNRMSPHGNEAIRLLLAGRRLAQRWQNATGDDV